MIRKTDNPCGNPGCRCSTTLDGRMSYGRGKLDSRGFFRHGCVACARDFNDRHAETVAMVGDTLLREGHTLQAVIEYVTAEPWLTLPAWPDTHS